jgi:hypothetical protein
LNELNGMKASLLIELLNHIDPNLLSQYATIYLGSISGAVATAKLIVNRLRADAAVRPKPGEYWKNRDGFVEGPLFAIPQEAGGPEGYVLGALSRGHMTVWRQDGTCNQDTRQWSPYDLVIRVGRPESVPVEKAPPKGPGGNIVKMSMIIPTEDSHLDA